MPNLFLVCTLIDAHLFLRVHRLRGESESRIFSKIDASYILRDLL